MGCFLKTGCSIFLLIILIGIFAPTPPFMKMQDAIKKDDIKELQKLLDEGISVDVTNSYKRTPLIYAVGFNKLESAKFLLKNGANINAKTNYGKTALYDACHYAKSEMIQLLLNNGADANIADNQGDLPLHIAFIMKQPPEVLISLINKTKDLNKRMKTTGATPLFYAVKYSTYEVINAIIKKNADTNIPAEDGDTPVKLAALMNKYNTVKLLLENKANPNLLNQQGRNALDIVMISQNSSKNNPKKDYTAMIELLKKYGAVESKTYTKKEPKYYSLYSFDRVRYKTSYFYRPRVRTMYRSSSYSYRGGSYSSGK